MTAADWKEIDAAFASNDDPLAGEDVKPDFRALFHQITMLAAPPIGLDRARRRGDR